MKLRIISILIFSLISAKGDEDETSHNVAPLTIPLTRHYKGTLGPEDSLPLKVDFRQWAETEITSIAEHGSQVQKGQTLMTLNSSKLDTEILKIEAKVKMTALEAAKITQTITHLKKSMPLKLEASRLKVSAAKEDLAYFKKSLEPIQRKKAEKTITDMQKALEYTQAEYDQLKKMYSEDQVTEETEEIILERQKDRLRHRRFAVEEVSIKTEQELTYLIPRELQKLKTLSRVAELESAKLKVDLPAELDRLNAEVEVLEVTKQSLIERLDKLRTDKERMVVKAEASGTLFYGIFSPSGWNTKVSSHLKIGKSMMNGTHWGTLVTTPSVNLKVKLDEIDATLLTVGSEGRGTVYSLPGVGLKTQLKHISNVPVSPGEYLATFAISVPEGYRIWAGQKIEVAMTARTLENAYIIPETFIHRDKEKHLRPYVWLKTNQGVIKQPVATGIQTDNGIQVIKGIQQGNVIFKTHSSKEAKQ